MSLTNATLPEDWKSALVNSDFRGAQNLKELAYKTLVKGVSQAKIEGRNIYCVLCLSKTNHDPKFVVRYER